MINLHWSTIVYVIVIALIAVRMNAIRWSDEWGIGSVFWQVVIVVFTAIWGGIFWW